MSTWTLEHGLYWSPICYPSSYIRTLHTQPPQVTAHHEALLIQASGVGELEGKLAKVKFGLDEVTASQEKCVDYNPFAGTRSDMFTIFLTAYGRTLHGHDHNFLY